MWDFLMDLAELVALAAFLYLVWFLTR